MANYYNPNAFFPVTYQNPMGYQVQPVSYGSVPLPQNSQQSFASAPKAMEWVEGEVGAKAYQMPQGWPANQPIPLWDSTDTIIWMKSWSPMGFPNPLQKIHYTLPEQQNALNLPNGQSGEGNGNMSGAAAPDMSQYVTKDDLNSLRQEIVNLKNAGNSGNNNYSNSNQNGSNNSGNRGGNR